MNIEAVKAIAKALGVKGFRKLRLKRELYTIGKQCAFMDTQTATSLIKRVQAVGFEVEGLSTCLELAEKGLLDTVTIKPRGII
ncbi:hypothetical protein BHH47_00455 [Salmonella enterica]|uniref:hypothetical protein n=1 Tax=Salmonella enterica TaxID=28901 RepID=UPI000D57E341|nr:hypothetical protein [Salmonella enterica]EDD4939528.1 hypothetical protein [Salmonella enterica subsp. enterica serovar Typhimurium]EAR3610354.1 hypothetical protein [Salmonella enterica]EAT4181244.1 hypothetical protein [Salmonella enterica]EAT4615418.1 hypothetical protein [Salmonella enterica]EBB1528229.1 hypothetical protein [Salmonella enterica]